jgi:alkylation response protein AidB-like acyl-CoA dehydrogenase
MDFGLTEEQLMLRGLVERFVAERYADPKQRASYRSAANGWSADNWAMLGELGLLALPLPADHGGLGSGPVELITLLEGLGRGVVVEPVLEHVVLGAGALAEAGDDATRERFLPAVADGSRHVALAHLEQPARFAAEAVATVARRTDDGWRLDGEKFLVPAGAGADLYVVTARADGALAQFVVAADAAGLVRRALPLLDGSVACGLTLAGAPALARLPGGGDALAACLDRGRVAICAETVGLMQFLLDATLDYVRARKQFGQPLARFQALQHRLADQYVALELARSQLYRAALVDGPPEERRRAIAGAKSFIANAAVALGEECIQLHGAMGVSEELPIGSAHKRILLLATLFGDADHELDRYLGLAA